MKRTILIVITLLGIVGTTSACVDPLPSDSVGLNILIPDSVPGSGCELFIELTNLRLMSGAPNHFCSCGLNDAIAGLGTIDYVVFVDSMTNEPVIGFDPFESNVLAGQAWDLASGGVDWNGFVSEVNGASLIDQAVKLWVRVTAVVPQNFQGFSFLPCDDPEALVDFLTSNGAVGTDEWDPVNQDLMDDHQGIHSFAFSEVEVYFIDYWELLAYDQIVNEHFNNIDEQAVAHLDVFPNPASESFFVENYPVSTKGYEIRDLQGRLLQTALLPNSTGRALVDVSELDSGTYLLRLLGLRNEVATRFVKAD